VFQMEFAQESNIAYWLTLDRHIAEDELRLKIKNKRCYIIKDDDRPIGILRYNLFWDNLPFLTMIYLEEEKRQHGFGSKAMHRWESEMKSLGYPVVMTSTQADETAQFFYRKLGYKDNGCLVMDIPAVRQPLEIMLIKEL
jgi:GNAT superfamily N-acetyltransferase